MIKSLVKILCQRLGYSITKLRPAVAAAVIDVEIPPQFGQCGGIEAGDFRTEQGVSCARTCGAFARSVNSTWRGSRFDFYGTVFIGRLPAQRVHLPECEEVHCGIVHGHKDLAAGD